MYSTCLFCHRSLGRNEAVESFPVGRRLAFDARKGRLWVVCRACGRWNLTPLEARWEAVEECERLFGTTRLRMATANIGLARLPDGTDLVRVGAPTRPEMAAWRYGAQLGRRRRETLLKVGLGVGVVGAVVAGGAVAGVVSVGLINPIMQLTRRIVNGSPRTVVARLDDAGGRVVDVRRKHVAKAQLRPGGAGDWLLEVPVGRHDVLLLTGELALRAAGLLLPAVNRFGGTRAQVEDAVGLLRHGDANANFAAVVRLGAADGGHVAKMAAPFRLALEMAAHEEQERRAMEGELAELERAWQDAEEIAAIADDMFLPDAVTAGLRRLRGG
jgi:hypothetical protein